MFGYKTNNQLLLEYLQRKVIELEERLNHIEDIIKIRSLKQKRINVWHSPEDMT